MSERLDRIEATLDSQLVLNAELRTSMEILYNTVESQSREIADLRSTAESLLQIVQLHQGDIEILAVALRQHRSDGHGQ